MEVGLIDQRIGTELCLEFAQKMAQDYERAGTAGALQLKTYDSEGHVYHPIHSRDMVGWLAELGFIEAAEDESSGSRGILT